MKRPLLILVFLLLLASTAYVLIAYYGYVFAKTVRGEIAKVERVNQETIIAGANVPKSHVFSFAVAIKDDKGEYHTASSEDRQWAVAERGRCVEAKFYPYPPWELDRSGTYYGARLIRLFECPPSLGKAEPSPPIEPPLDAQPAGDTQTPEDNSQPAGNAGLPPGATVPPTNSGD